MDAIPSKPAIENTDAANRGDDNAHRVTSLDVIERPSTGIVLTIASGPRAGEMIGTDENEFFMGYHPDCLVRFSPLQYPHANARILFRRSREGWCISLVSGDSTFINQQQLDGKLVLRSGDIVRLSALGPDIQFTMQSGGLAVKSLVQRFLLATTAEQDLATHSTSRSTAGAASASASAMRLAEAPGVPVGTAENLGQRPVSFSANWPLWLIITGIVGMFLLGLVGVAVAIRTLLLSSEPTSLINGNRATPQCLSGAKAHQNPDGEETRC